MKIRKKMSVGNADDMRIGDILCENVRMTNLSNYMYITAFIFKIISIMKVLF